ncbi:hypothetical protein LEP1GSC021_0619 [Leptospira noguchii str. 1993005606]|uniref:Uncharacterized protein n=1 Tax=Leptospira noguchii str. 2007001578 TaxID=1049974 RepID=A0ABN0IYE3_9LEPT|nr:hypothetical protein [Leptospira noguchii]EMM99595.1 hypothetical protein LEP1GSC035_1210 [Leptospira noguchii str. 2007001578]EPE82306.1 hypothetical protein LEP1GSC021_0619 [Leptospira noguchii str. 1993005606]
MKNTIDPNRGIWVKLISKKDDFIKIVSTLNEFYIPKVHFSKLDKGQQIRVRLVQKKSKDFEVFLKKRNDHEFVIFLKVEDQFESWIHQDGIGEAKERFLMEGKTDHLVFEFPCIGDLYEKHCSIAKEDEMKTLNTKDSA